MSKVLSCSAIVDLALREIGTFSSYDLSADPLEHEIGLGYLDLAIAELVGIENLWFLQPARQVITIPASVTSFPLQGLLTTKLQFFNSINVILPETAPLETECVMIRRSEYDAIATKDATGDPQQIYIERNDNPNAYVWPTASRAGIQLVIDGQAYAADSAANQGRNTTAFPAAWQRYLIKRLAADLGGGPVTTIPADERTEKKTDAQAALMLLLPRNNREQIKRPMIVQPYDPLTAGALLKLGLPLDYGQ